MRSRPGGATESRWPSRKRVRRQEKAQGRRARESARGQMTGRSGGKGTGARRPRAGTARLTRSRGRRQHAQLPSRHRRRLRSVRFEQAPRAASWEAAPRAGSWEAAPRAGPSALAAARPPHRPRPGTRTPAHRHLGPSASTVRRATTASQALSQVLEPGRQPSRKRALSSGVRCL